MIKSRAVTAFEKAKDLLATVFGNIVVVRFATVDILNTFHNRRALFSTTLGTPTHRRGRRNTIFEARNTKVLGS
jgi:hypothetical protein